MFWILVRHAFTPINGRRGAIRRCPDDDHAVFRNVNISPEDKLGPTISSRRDQFA